MMEKITVIVPVYNVEKYLKKCLESIRNQTYRDLEIICINDGSRDHSLEICKEVAEKDRRIIILDQENKGLAAVRNRGIKEAVGNYLAFVDSDDFIDDDYIEKLYNCLIQNSADISVANVKYENVEQERYLLTDEFKTKKLLNRKEAMCEFLNPSGGLGNYIVNKLYKKSVFDGISFPENKLFEDAYTMFRILDHVNKVAIEMGTNYHYYIRNDSITGNYEENFQNYDLLNANLEKAHFICENYPELSSLVFHQYFTAFLWITNRSAIKEIDNNKILADYLKDLQNLYHTYHIKPYDLKEKISFFVLSCSLPIYKFVYKKLKGDR